MRDSLQSAYGALVRFVVGIRRNRFVFLLGTLLALLLSLPVLHLVTRGSHPLITRVTVSVLVTAMLLSAVFAACRSRLSVRIGLWLAIPAMVLHEIGVFLDWGGIVGTGYLFNVAFLAYTVAVIVRFLFTRHRITFNTIAASLCAYLLLGLLWANLYSLIEVLEPGSFALSVVGDHESASMRFGGEQSILPLYYSLVTLSTLGYGDVVPVSPAARLLASTEAVVGQLYIAVLVARLVGLQISQSATNAGRTDRPLEEECDD